ncbi:TrkH-domain-containing protein [Heliocybe sulcata]|uniref:Potassium transport protein n=1 Tax=Heliocybe sulcata TaxID=5364 RepID=A0A5C3MTS6_9AGAM|nr:TrkH-domain-containing protein [Heliocybe sulcata]
MAGEGRTGYLTLLPALNFYRIHLLLFILTPLVFSAILWRSNGRFKIAYIDSLFLCVSSVTGTGLYTVDLSALTAWQQAILVFLELIGSPVAVSWVVVLVRRHYFVNHLRHIIRAELDRTKFQSRMNESKGDSEAPKYGRQGHPPKRNDKPFITGMGSKGVNADMIHRVDAAPRLIGAMDFSEQSLKERNTGLHSGTSALSSGLEAAESNTPVAKELLRHDTQPRVDFAASTPSEKDSPSKSDPSISKNPSNCMTTADPFRGKSLVQERTLTRRRTRSLRQHETDFGGFAGPADLVSNVIRRATPNLHTHLTRTMTMPHTVTITGTANDECTEDAGRPVPYISFNAVVDRNSMFRKLSEEDLRELGGVEYRALNALLWIVPAYYIGILAVSFAVIAPYMSLPRWKSNFLPPQQHRAINPIWFSVFQIVAAWANTGMSLVDQNMIPFQTAYPMIFFLILCILAGNTAFVRMSAWILAKCTPRESRLYETYHFLLDHPRRCFIYLFPSRQTWFLVLMLLFMNCTDWFFFLILDIGNSAITSIPLGTRIVLGLLQACAVRTAGFQSVVLSALAPAVKFLYTVMMYISVYPVAMSVRTTNVYEEQSLGIYEEEAEIDDNDEQFNSGSRVAIWGRYIFVHIRRQLAFDMWWLAFALFLLCIIEAHNLNDAAEATWFNIFQLTFELVSAYGTVGLSLGIPTANYSFAGALKTLSKLILCAVMLRGRHRGLPVALDRAVLLPSEFRPKEKDRQQPDLGTPGIPRTNSLTPEHEEIAALDCTDPHDLHEERQKSRAMKRI